MDPRGPGYTQPPDHERYQSVPPIVGQLMGAKEKKEDGRNIMMMSVVDAQLSPPPALQDWQKRYKRPFTPYHGQRYGSCTISSQAEGLRVWARREQFGRDLFVPEQVIDDRYFALTQREYGGGDEGAYELDALKDFRTIGFTYKGRTHRIDAFTEVQIDKEQIKQGVHIFRGVKICYAVTQTMYNSAPDAVVHNDGSNVVGYHSMYAYGYDSVGLWMVHTWNRPPQLFAWDFVLNRATEVYTCVDAKDIRLAGKVNIRKLKAAVKEAVAAAA